MQSQGLEVDVEQEKACLKFKLEHKIIQYETLMCTVAYKSKIIDQHELRIKQLEQETLEHIAERQAWIAEKAALLEQLEAKRNMQNLIDDLKYVSGLLSTTLAEERACKRARANDD